MKNTTEAGTKYIFRSTRTVSISLSTVTETSYRAASATIPTGSTRKPWKR